MTSLTHTDPDDVWLSMDSRSMLFLRVRRDHDLRDRDEKLVSRFSETKKETEKSFLFVCETEISFPLFYETETRPRKVFSHFSRPRRDREKFSPIFRDRDEKFKPISRPFRDRDEKFLKKPPKISCVRWKLGCGLTE